MPGTAIDSATLKSQFSEQFGSGGKIHIVRAPGRVNLIGEHTDYNDGFVLPMAIEQQMLVTCRGRGDSTMRIASSQFPDEVCEFSIEGAIERGDKQWASYARGMAHELVAAGIPLVGMEARITNTLPVGGGLSSSAALLVGTGLAMLTISGLTMDPMRLALIAQRAEHEFANVPSGIMDQTIVAAAKSGHAMLLDCRDLTKQFVPLDANELRVIVVNSMVKHQLSGGEYAKRRKECEQGVAHFAKSNPSIKALRDVSLKQLEAAKDALPDVVYRRCRHVISENGRTLDFAAQLTKKNYETGGEDMVASHQSLRDDYEVSCPELDFLVEQAMKVRGVYGARMTGAGFGGSMIALAQPRAIESFTQTISTAFAKQFGQVPGIFATHPMAGASVVE